jgi:hypothetical protein
VHRHFQTLFEYIDIQKIRTPKGLDWLKAQYPTLTQNELMFEMQGIRMVHCTIRADGVREIAPTFDQAKGHAPTCPFSSQIPWSQKSGDG